MIATTPLPRSRLKLRAAFFWLLLLPLGLAAKDSGPAGWHDVRDFGARPDGTTICTAAFNRAVEAAVAAGGGTVYVPPGRYLTGTVYLQSNVTFHLEAGAVLLGSTDLKDYPENPAPVPADTLEFRRSQHVYPSRLEFGRYSLIYAAGQQNVAVVGRGVIDGQGDHPNFSKKELVARGLTRDEAHFRRPYALGFVRCSNVRVRDVTFRNLAFWCQDYLDCEDVLVDGVTVDSPAVDRNNDGIDIDGSRRVRVANCRFDTGDDSICLKASYRDCEDIVITNCVCSSLANGVKFGTASNGGFRNVAVSNIAVQQAGASGLALELVDGGTMDGIAISNLVMDEVGAAIFIKLGDRGSRWMKPEHHKVGTLRNISISNVVAKVFTPYDARPLGNSITGVPGHFIENVTLSNIRLISVRDQPREATRAIATAPVPENAADYPEYSMLGELPAHGLFVRHVRGLTLENVEFSFSARDHRSALVCDDVQDVEVRGLRARVLPEAEPVVRFTDVQRAAITGTVAPPDAGIFLRVEGDSADISVTGADLSRAREPVLLAPGLAPAAVRR